MIARWWHLQQKASSEPSTQSVIKSHSGFSFVMHSLLSQVNVFSGHLPAVKDKDIWAPWVFNEPLYDQQYYHI